MLFRGAKCFKTPPPPPPTAYIIFSQALFPPLDQKKKLHFTLYIRGNTNLSKRARTLHQQEKKKININKLVMHDGSQLTLIVQVYFPFTREW